MTSSCSDAAGIFGYRSLSYPDPSVAGVEDYKNDLNLFETSARVVEKAFTAAVSTASLKLVPRRVDSRGSLSGTEGTVGPNQTNADVFVSGRSARHLEKPFIRGEPLLFHHSPRQYTLSQKGSSKMVTL